MVGSLSNNYNKQLILLNMNKISKIVTTIVTIKLFFELLDCTFS